jgi:hypothetical protein
MPMSAAGCASLQLVSSLSRGFGIPIPAVAEPLAIPSLHCGSAEVWFAEPVVEDDRAAVAWWTIFVAKDGRKALPDDRVHRAQGAARR